jgi:DNA invertase Pin-like site-specific DNA recombinase
MADLAGDPGRGPKASHALTFTPDHPVGAGQERGVGLRVLTGQGSAVDTTRADGRLIFAVFAALAEFERGVISERTRAGLKAARPRKMTASKIRMAMAAMADPDARPKDIARELGVTTTTLYAHVNGDGSAKAAAEAVLHRPARP